MEIFVPGSTRALLYWNTKSGYNWRSAGQSVLESSPHLGPNTRLFISVRLLLVCWRVEPSLTRWRICRLQFIVKVVLRLRVSQSVFVSSLIWGSWPNELRFSLYSLDKDRIENTASNNSLLWRQAFILGKYFYSAMEMCLFRRCLAAHNFPFETTLTAIVSHHERKTEDGDQRMEECIPLWISLISYNTQHPPHSTASRT
jgi:hypothetical protein